MPEPLDLQAIRERVIEMEAPTWTVAKRPTSHGYAIGPSPDSMYKWSRNEGWKTLAHAEHKAVAEFIAHAYTDIPALLEEIERLRTITDEQVTRAGRAVRDTCSPGGTTHQARAGTSTAAGDEYFESVARAALEAARDA